MNLQELIERNSSKPKTTTENEAMTELHKIEPSLENVKDVTGPERDYEAELKQAADDIRMLEGEVKRSGVTIQQLNHEVDRLTDIIKRVVGI